MTSLEFGPVFDAVDQVAEELPDRAGVGDGGAAERRDQRVRQNLWWDGMTFRGHCVLWLSDLGRWSTPTIQQFPELARRRRSLTASWVQVPAESGRPVARREEAGGVLAAAGLEVLDDTPCDAFRHPVDQVIQRDILVAGKPGRTV
ncbi:hypothetical protein KZZ52_14400 [Dactylosporangium sp. AC04546]|uniref:hypothetical protein n=1 Tax=Dactylosporangium sp. AC04546 TaxID=2862460 RepID=UPI001EE0B7C3|nr:hypothetical protein [Dactylosporangium sp. AC04546]WVK86508.1 hypothetical protein KZZ52_14400 [Dactylosporangium sp. AC04546]